MTANRGVSAAVDAALCLLLVSASVLTLTAVSPPGPAGETEVRRGAELLGATTATVSYADGSRVARGTVAALLADAAVLTARAGRHPEFVAGVKNSTRRALAGLPGEMAVRVRWRPTPGAPVAGRLSVGERPPANVDVRAAEFTIPAGGRANRSARGRAVIVVRGWDR
ncbi:MAG: hypothetical protein ABEJ68_06215 [Halobacteriaceae archaeon]